MFKNKKNIEFVSVLKGLELIPECVPIKSNKSIPTWWKNMPKQEPWPNLQTVKVCPGIPDFFKIGYILPMWADTSLYHNPEDGRWAWNTGRPDYDTIFSANVHPDEQFIDHANPHLQGVGGSKVFKLDCPWRIFTPKGYSVLQLPLFYHYNNDFSVLPGVINTDTHHYINQQVMYHGNGKNVVIKRGTPLVMYIPFKRDDTSLDMLVRYQNEVDKDRIQNLDVNLSSMFPGSGAYNKLSKNI